MLDSDQPDSTTDAANAGTGPTESPAAPAAPVVTRRTRKAPAKKAAAAPVADTAADTPAQDASAADAPAEAPVAKKAARKAPARKSAAKKAPARTAAPADDAVPAEIPSDAPAEATAGDAPVAKKAAAKRSARTPAKKTAAKKAAPAEAAVEAPADEAAEDTAEDTAATDAATGHAVLFQPPVVTTTRRTRKKAEPARAEPADADQTQPGETESETASETESAEPAPAKKASAKSGQKSGQKSGKKSGKRTSKKGAAPEPVADADEDADEETPDALESAESAESAETASDESESDESQDEGQDEGQDEDSDGEGGPARRRRRRGGRRRRKSSDGGGEGSDADAAEEGSSDEPEGSGDTDSADAGEGNGEGSSRRRRRRRRAGEESSDDDEPNTVTRVRSRRSAEDQITSVQGSTRLEAKKQRRREGREAGRRRAPIVSEAEFLARREAVDRVMVIRQRNDLTQIAVLEDRVLVEHYVARESQTSLIGNVYLGRVQNVLPSMEAAFIDIGKGRNAVLYAGEVNWQSLGHKEGSPRKIESVLSSGQMILVQVTKDPIGHKGARLTSQVSLAGRFLVYVPDGTTSGISRKLPDTERNRLKTLLKEIVPDTAGVIVRTAAEGASEDELTHDVERLKARWEDIEKKATNKGSGPQLLYGEPDLTLKVVRDLFTEDFSKLVIEGDDAWETVRGYVESVAPDLVERVEKYERNGAGDVFSTYRIDEQIHKGLDRKVWLPSGGSLIIDRTEAMTVVDVNTGKFTGSGGNLEETVTKNNLEAAEEIVRQLRLRDIGGIIVVDFIDMVLESNRDLVVRRLVECLGRDRTRHQVAEVTSLGLVQMTRKRIGTGLLEAFSENCEHCHGRGVVIKDQPVDPNARGGDDGEGKRGSRRRGRRGASGDNDGNGAGNGGDKPTEHHAPSPKDVAAMARHEKPADEASEDAPAEVTETPETGKTPETPETPETSEQPESLETPPTTEPAPSADSDEAPRASVETPAHEEQAEATPEAAEAPVAEPSAEESAEESVEPSAEPSAEEAPVEVEKPRVVTRTRRRSASRPAGPPALSEAAPVSFGVTGTLPDSGAVEPGTADVEPGLGTPAADDAEPGAEAPHVEHVPIKKKGSRKR